MKNLLALPPHPPLWKPTLSRHGSRPTAGKTRVWSGVDKIKEKRVKARLLQGSRISAHLLLASSRHAGRGGDTGSRKKLQTVRTFLQPHTHLHRFTMPHGREEKRESRLYQWHRQHKRKSDYSPLPKKTPLIGRDLSPLLALFPPQFFVAKILILLLYTADPAAEHKHHHQHYYRIVLFF